MALPKIRPLSSTRTALLAASALVGLAPRGALAQAVAGTRVPQTSCTGAGAAPTREALRAAGAGSIEESVTRQLMELRAAQVAASAAVEGGGAASTGGLRVGRGGERTEVIRLSAPGYLGLRMLETSDVRLTAAGRLVRYCSYPVVLSVTPESPADRAGLQEGDTLVAYNDRDLVRSGEIQLDRLLVPGDTVRVSLRRERRALTLPVVVGRQRVTGMVRLWSGEGANGLVVFGAPGAVAAPAAPVFAGAARTPTARSGVPAPRPRVSAAPTPVEDVTIAFPTPAEAPAVPPTFTYFGPMGPTPLAGAQLLTMDDDLRTALGARAGAGVVVVRVIPGSPAALVGLRSGDVIRTADGRPVTSPLGFQRVLAVARAVAPGEERPVQVEVERRGQRKTITLKW